MGFGNVSERRSAPPQVGVSVVIPEGDTGNSAADSGNAANSAHSRLWLPLVKRVRQPFLGCWALPGGDLRSDRSLEQSAYAALESTTDLHPRYLEQLYTFGGPTRSHGGLPMVSVVYWALVGQTEAAGFEDGDNVTARAGVRPSPDHRLRAAPPALQNRILRRGHPTARPHVHPAPTARRL